MNFFSQQIISENQQIQMPILNEKGVELYIKREDKIHEFVSGNKFRKLTYNIAKAKELQKDTILTFGGAYSNHIVATAVAGKLSGLKTIGIIRGDELANRFNEVITENYTLKTAHNHQMQFKFITRELYRKKHEKEVLELLKNEFGDFYTVPEGGTNLLAIKGCEEVLTAADKKFDYICAAVGTGGTLTGIINSAHKQQQVIGFPALKERFLTATIKQLTTKQNWHLQPDYHFGGYAKFDEVLIRFINDFYLKTQIPLDPIYTGKMLFGILNLVSKNFFKRGSKILAIHTGGLQGVHGVNKKLRSRCLQEIQFK